LSVVRHRKFIRNKTGSDPAYSTGVVGAVVPLTILAVVVFFYTRHRRQQQTQPQMLNQDGLDPYKRPPSMYGPGVTSAPFTPYVSLSCGVVHGKRLTFFFFSEPRRSNDFPSSEPTKFDDIHHSYPQHPWYLFWCSRGVSAGWFSESSSIDRLLIIRFPLKPRAGIFPDQFSNLLLIYSDSDVSHFLDIQHLKYGTHPFKNYTVAVGEVSAFGWR